MSGMPNLKQQLRRARQLGLEVRKLNRTGEVLVRVDPSQPGLRLNVRKKGGSLMLQRLLDRIDPDRKTS